MNLEDLKGVSFEDIGRVGGFVVFLAHSRNDLYIAKSPDDCGSVLAGHAIGICGRDPTSWMGRDWSKSGKYRPKAYWITDDKVDRVFVCT